MESVPEMSWAEDQFPGSSLLTTWIFFHSKRQVSLDAGRRFPARPIGEESFLSAMAWKAAPLEHGLRLAAF